MQRRSKTSEARAVVAPETMSPNKSANTDPHLHKAASPLKVVVRLPLR